MVFSRDDLNCLFESPNKTMGLLPNVRFCRIASTGGYLFRFSTGVDVVVSGDTTEVSILSSRSVSTDIVALYILGPVLGFILRKRGILCLHASCIRIGDKAAAFVGRSGAGKSTLAAYFLERGCSVISDDLLRIDDERGCLWAVPSYPRVRLWSDSLEALFGQPNAHPQLSAIYPKHYVDLGNRVGAFCAEPVPLEMIYFLRGDAGARGRTTVDNRRRAARIFDLIANSSACELLEDDMRKAELASMGQLVQRAKFRFAYRGADHQKLSQLYEAVRRDVRAISSK